MLSSYNKLFYENELKATISEVDSEEKQLLSQVRANISKLLTFDLRRSCKAPCDANDNYGIFFCGVRGREEQVPESSSWSNPSEVYSVILLSIGRFYFHLTSIQLFQPLHHRCSTPLKVSSMI